MNSRIQNESLTRSSNYNFNNTTRNEKNKDQSFCLLLLQHPAKIFKKPTTQLFSSSFAPPKHHLNRTKFHISFYPFFQSQQTKPHSYVPCLCLYHLFSHLCTLSLILFYENKTIVCCTNRASRGQKPGKTLVSKSKGIIKFTHRKV